MTCSGSYLLFSFRQKAQEFFIMFPLFISLNTQHDGRRLTALGDENRLF